MVWRGDMGGESKARGGRIVFWLLLAFAGCGKATHAPTTASTVSSSDQLGESLFVRLGGIDRIRVLVDEFVSNLASDERINRFFMDTDITRFKNLLTAQICVLSKGPCVYEGRSMRNVHAGMGVDSKDFAALMEGWNKSLDTLNVSPRVQRELGALFERIVQR